MSPLRHRPPLPLAACIDCFLDGLSAPASTVRVQDLQRDSGYSARHFAALFREAVGVGPKHYQRLRRFNAAVRALAQYWSAADRADFADLAVAAGYSDQPHLIREFRAFAGVTPGQYRPLAPDSPLHHVGQVRNVQ